MAPHSAMVSSQNINGDASGNWDEAVGIKFKPTDEILIRDYLVNKMSGSTDGPIFPLIKEVDVYQQEPSELRNVAHNFKDGNMYFFSPLRKKYGKGTIFKRKAGDGCWKKSELPSDVKDGTGKVIGTKTSLAYHKNDKKRKATIETQWLMKEYMVQRQNDEQTKMTLCVVYYRDKKRKPRDCDEEEPEGFTAAATEDSRKRQRHSSCTSNNSPPLHGSSSPVPGATLEQSLPYNPNYCQNTPSMMNGFLGAPAPNHFAPLHSNSSSVVAVTLEQSRPSDPNYCHNMPNMMNGSLSALVPNYCPPSLSSLPSYSNDYQYMENMMIGSRSTVDLENWDLIEELGESLDKLFSEFANNPHSQTQLDQFQNNTITQSISVDNNEDPSCLNSAEHL